MFVRVFGLVFFVCVRVWFCGFLFHLWIFHSSSKSPTGEYLESEAGLMSIKD